MFDLLRLELVEAERIAYAENQPVLAELFGRILDLQEERDEIEEAFRETVTLEDWENFNGSVEAYKEFFEDCFDHLGELYPYPSIESDYDKSIIFDAIERGENHDD